MFKVNFNPELYNYKLFRNRKKREFVDDFSNRIIVSSDDELSCKFIVSLLKEFIGTKNIGFVASGPCIDEIIKEASLGESTIIKNKKDTWETIRAIVDNIESLSELLEYWDSSVTSKRCLIISAEPSRKEFTKLFLSTPNIDEFIKNIDIEILIENYPDSEDYEFLLSLKQEHYNFAKKLISKLISEMS